MLTIEQMQADIAFLLHRSSEAGSCSFDNDRFTGMSSNALVRFAYGGKHNCMPSDRSDYAACVRTVRMLPQHRRTPAVMAALWEARRQYLLRYPGDENALARRERKQEWERKQKQMWERRAKRRAKQR
jgi:hypothetical protein